MDNLKQTLLTKINQITEQLALIKEYEKHWPLEDSSQEKTKKLLEKELAELKQIVENKPL